MLYLVPLGPLCLGGLTAAGRREHFGLMGCGVYSSVAFSACITAFISHAERALMVNLGIGFSRDMSSVCRETSGADQHIRGDQGDMVELLRTVPCRKV